MDSTNSTTLQLHVFYLADVVVGFEQTNIDAIEILGKADLCVRVFVPTDMVEIPFFFFLDPTTVSNGSASMCVPSTHNHAMLINTLPLSLHR